MFYAHRTNKYGAKKTEFNGRVFDSKHEASVASDIELLPKSGEVVEVLYQPSFNLYGKNGSRICIHRPDFLLTFKDGHKEVWEAKGLEVGTFKIKLKLFIDNFPEYDYFLVKQSGSYYAYRRPTGKADSPHVKGTGKWRRAA